MQTLNGSSSAASSTVNETLIFVYRPTLAAEPNVPIEPLGHDHRYQHSIDAAHVTLQVSYHGGSVYPVSGCKLQNGRPLGAVANEVGDFRLHKAGLSLPHWHDLGRPSAPSFCHRHRELRV